MLDLDAVTGASSSVSFTLAACDDGSDMKARFFVSVDGKIGSFYSDADQSDLSC